MAAKVFHIFFKWFNWNFPDATASIYIATYTNQIMHILSKLFLWFCFCCLYKEGVNPVTFLN